MKKKVVILGGGVAGMSAAHELAERGFDVAVYEYKTIPGGKARSMPVVGTGIDGRQDLPGEHGFRFFPGFYKHLPDTMKRIPFGDNEQGVFDNLVQAPKMGMARFDKPTSVLLLHFPSSLDDVMFMIQSLISANFGLSQEDLEFAAHKMWQVLSSCPERKIEDLTKISWWDFCEADTRSQEFQELFVAVTRTLVAAKAREANAKTIGDVMTQLMLDNITPGVEVDRVLNGPTNEVWIDPWRTYLESLGVDYRLGAEVTAIHCQDGQIVGASIREGEEQYIVQGDYYICALPVEVTAKLMSEEIIEADKTLAGLQELGQSVDWMTGIQFYLRRDVRIAEGHVIYMDSPWALTSICQQQFWHDYDLATFGDGEVRGILSVDVSDWHTPGIVFGKPAMACTKEEIHIEVWEQLKKSINVDGLDLLRDEDVVLSHLDPDIVFVNPHETINVEPLLVNKVGTWELRPNAYTRIPNLFLASDYVRTNTDLATMEGANEAARRAVNAILADCEYEDDLCEIYDMYQPLLLALWRHHDRNRYEKGLPWDGKLFSLA